MRRTLLAAVLLCLGGPTTLPVNGAPTHDGVISLDNRPLLHGPEEDTVLAIGGMEAETADGTTGAETGGRGDFTHTLRYSYTSTTVLQAQDDAGAIIDAEFKIVPLTSRRHGHQLVVEWVEHRQIRGEGLVEKMDDGNYSSWFSFTVNAHGEVQDCRYPPDEPVHIIEVKKEMVAVASATLKMPPTEALQNGAAHSYHATDNDRNGQHTARYSVVHGANGNELHFNKIRNLPEAKHLTRTQDEHIVASNDAFMTVRSVDIHETSDMLPTSHSSDAFSDMPGTRSGGIRKSEDMTDHGQSFKFATSSKTSLRLLGVYAAGSSTADKSGQLRINIVKEVAEPSGLKRTTVEAHPRAQGSVPLDEIVDKLDEKLECVFNEHIAKNSQDTGHHEGNQCFRSFRKLLQSLTSADLVAYCGEVLSDETGDWEEDYEYMSITVDALTDIGSPEAQQLIVDRIFQVEDPDADTIKRVMISTASLVHPLPELIAAVEQLAHGEGKTEALREIHVVNHAMLALGAYSGMLYALNQGNARDAEAARIVHTIAEKMPPKSDRPRRFYGKPRTEAMSKWDSRTANLLEALGNTAHPDAKLHILKHAHDYSANILVRASSVHALRFHAGADIEDIMTEKILFDPHQHVRETAHHAFTSIKRSKPIEQVHKEHREAVQAADANNMTLAGRGRRFVSFPNNFPDEMYSKTRARRSGVRGNTELARSRRFLPDDLGTDQIPDLNALQDDLLEGSGIADLMDMLHFDLQLPGFDWGLRVGVPDFFRGNGWNPY
jgi:hypothetical protein